MKTRDLVDYLHDRFIGTDPKRLREAAEIDGDYRVARILYDLREEAGLTQARLGKKIGLSAKMIDNIEMADYEGNMLGVLIRVADLLGHEVDLRVRPAKERTKRKSA